MNTGAFDTAAGSRHPHKLVWFDLLVIGGAWAATLLVAWPLGDFPSGDDWAYGLAVRRLLETGRYLPADWGNMTQISHIVWGTLFSATFGFSFHVLRVSGLVMSLAGSIGMYVLLRQLGCPRWLVVSGTLVLMFNPLYYSLSVTFMTDVPFSALTIWTAFFLTRSLQSGSRADLVVGAVLAAVTTLSRQFGLVVPLTYAVAAGMARDSRTTRSILWSMLPFGLSLISLLTFELWMKWAAALPPSYEGIDALIQTIRAESPMFVARFMVIAALYIGWFGLPLFALGSRKEQETGWRPAVARTAGAAFAVCALVPLFRHEAWQMPRIGLNVQRAGIGELTLSGSDLMPVLPNMFWTVVTIMSLIGGVAFVTRGTRASVEAGADLATTRSSVRFLWLASMAFPLVAVLATGKTYDRYVLPALPLVIAAVASNVRVSQRIASFRVFVAAGAFALLAVFAVFGTRDYFSWNRSRWQAISDLMSAGVRADDIDGGFELNEWHRQEMGRGDGRRTLPRADARYTIAFGPIDGMRVVSTYAYSHWMPPYTGSILTLARKER